MSNGSSAWKPPKDHFTAVHLLVTIVLLLAAYWFGNNTDLGQELLSALRIGRVMSFSTGSSYGTILNNLQAICIILVALGIIAGFIFGLIAGDSIIGSAIAGGIIGGLVYLLICLVVFLFTNYLAALFVNMSSIIFALVFPLGCAVAIVNYVKYFFVYLNPYPKTPGMYVDRKRRYYQDENPNRAENGRRNYFFGPGYFSIGETIKNAWRANFQLIGNVWSRLSSHTLEWWDWLFWIPGLPFFLIFAVSVLVVGSVVTLTCSVVHMVLILYLMLITYILFSLVWAADRLVLKHRKTLSICGACKEAYLIPMFICPKCGARHRKLTPGKYGILFRRCSCGKRVPCTFLTGRSKLTACCPHCSTDKYLQRLENDVRPMSVQLVGGMKAGKTVYLASALTRIQDNLAVRRDTTVIPSDKGMMQELRRMYLTGSNSNTTDTNAVMYSLRVHSPAFSPDRLISIFDIAGEFFIKPESVKNPQLQLRNVDAIVMLVDILSLLRADEMAVMDARINYHRSQANNVAVLNGLIEHMDLVGAKRRNGRFTVPLNVVISKLDTVNELLKRIKLDDALMELIMAFIPGGDYPVTEEARDQICRSFIESRNETNLLVLMESNFSTVHYYAASAAGGEMTEGQGLHPWPGMLAPIYGVAEDSDTELYGLLMKGGL